MKEVICAYCGKNTYDVDIEYLIGGNHLSCVLMDQLSDAIDKEEKAKKKSISPIYHFFITARSCQKTWI